MDGNDFNLITPANSLQNIGSMTRTDRRQQRRQNKKNKRHQEDTPSRETLDESIEADQLLKDFVADKDDPHSIDYRA